MLKTSVKDCEIYIGINAGGIIFNSIKNAKKSITIVSPYVSPEYVDLLINAKNRGVEVYLLTSTDMATGDKKKEAQKKLIKQNQHLNEKAKKIRDRGRIIIVMLMIMAIAAGYQGYKSSHYELFWWLLAVPILFFAYKLFRKIKIFKYTYEKTIEIGLFVSPYVEWFSDDNLNVHSKIYIIDDEVVFIGSVNFTKAAFRKNYECLSMIKEKETIEKVAKEVITLINSERIVYKDVDEIGSKIYYEARN